MRPAETAAQLTRFAGRGAGTDAERRAARWLAAQLCGGGRTAEVQTFWCRPNWPLAQFWHCVLAVAGSVVIVHHPRLGGGLALAALVCVLVDRATGDSPGRRLTRLRASQNVVSPAPAPPPAGEPHGGRVRLILTAHYDAGRTGLVYRTAPRALAAGLRRLAAGGRLAPGWLGWVTIALLILIGVAVARNGGAGGTALGAVQLLPTAALAAVAGLLLELAQAPFGPAANDNATGTAVALALARALDAAPPRNLDVDVVLQGAGDGDMTGLRRYLRARRRRLQARDTIVLGIAAAGAGQPRWWTSDGPLVPLRYHPRLRTLAAHAVAQTAALSPGDGRRPRGHRGRGTTPALPARARGLPALAIGCLDARGLALRSHQPGDGPDRLDPADGDALVTLALVFVDALDASLAPAPVSARSATAPATA